jgi:hypothetical protein
MPIPPNVCDPRNITLIQLTNNNKKGIAEGRRNGPEACKVEQRPNKDEPKQIREESKAAQGEASQTLEETKQANTGPRRVKSGPM